ncbi:MAG: molybdopterin cofactor-binding domain-containing protein [Chloroflexota bacterium]|nr:molybdopterin cofactor-binding domain-containing protein [Chloroflexota bacterium]
MSKQTQPPKTSSDGKQKGITRRRFLQTVGIGAGVLAVGAVIGGPTLVREGRLAINQAFLTGTAPSSAPPKSPFVWFEIDAQNQARLFIPKVEMGQGIHTTLAQIAADELELDWQTVTVAQADTTTGFDPDLIFTFGSTSVTALYAPIREIAAKMREMLRTEAAAQLGVDVAQLTAANSTISGQGGQSLTYGAIIAAKQGEWVIPEGAAALKNNADFTLIGQPIKRVDLRDKVTGRARYGYDARIEGMGYGAVARPPRYGATLASAAAGTAETMPGVIAVVIEDGFVGVVANTRRRAQAALAGLELTWEGGTNIGQAEIESIVSAPRDGGTLIQRVGGEEADGLRIEANYRTPMAVHAQMEPQAALARFEGDHLIIDCSTQAPGLTRERAAAVLGIDAAQIDVIPTYVGGAFGRKTGADVGVEAARLARGAGIPVHVGWTREEDTQHGYRRPPASNYLWATIDDTGAPTMLVHEIASSDVLFNPEVGGGGFLETMLGADPLAAYGGLLHYAIPNRRVMYHHTRIPVPTAYWRGLGSFANTFAIESFVDEVAHAGGIDPLEWRLRFRPEGDLGRRYELVLNAVAEASAWATTPADGRARGIAACYDRGTVVALVVEVSVTDGQINVHNAWCAVDPGLVVNPDGAAAQVQGSIIMGLSSTLLEAQTVENGMATSQNFNAYPLLTIRQAPQIEVIPINSGDEPVGGLGEPVMGAVPAAVANAVFALTGTRARTLPLKL